MYPENPEGTQVIVGSMNMGYISDAARNRTHNLFRPKREPIPLGHSDGHSGFLPLPILNMPILLPDPANTHSPEIVDTRIMSYTHPYISVFTS